MSYNDSDESDGEGFIPNKIIIKQIAKSSLSKQASNSQFQAHYLTGQTILKKQPLQSYNLTDNLSCYPIEFVQHHISQIIQDLPTLAQEYMSGRYELIYTRFAKPFDFGESGPFKNQIIVKPVKNLQNFRPLKSWNSQYIQYSQQSKLRFDSKFQGGNLLSAFKNRLQQNQYTLFMQNDTNTYGYNQWFYFSIREAKAKQKYVFKIVNFRKNYSFFPKGMQVYSFSLQQSKIKQTGWSLAGTRYKYYPSNFQEGSIKYYTLQFQIQFEHQNDFILIAPSLPYGYTKLIHQMTTYQEEASRKSINIQMVSISRSLGGNNVPYIKVYKQSNEKKKIAIIVARQHSGEVWSSYVLDEIIKGIASGSNKFYQWVIQQYDFHVFPMINVDGVIYGNFRCDMGGYDLNRCWKSPSQKFQPQIFYIKQKLSELTQNYLFDYFLDLHTHSRQHGFFGYSCSDSQLSRAYPLILSYLTPRFRYQACTFNITNDKKTTARSQVYDLTHHHQVITIQISAFGYRDMKTKRLCPFVPRDIKSIGSAIVHAFYYNKFRSETIQQVQYQWMNSKKPNLSYYPILEDEMVVSQSDSEPQVDQIQQSIKIKNMLRFVRQVSPQKKTRKKRVKIFKTNMTLTNSNKSFFQGENTLRIAAAPRARALTQQKRKKQSNLNISNDMKKNVRNIVDSKYTLNSFKKMLKFSPLNIAKSHLNAQIKIQLMPEPKPLNLLDFSLKKLPIYKSDKLPLMFQSTDGPRNFANFSNSKKISIKDANPKTKVATFYKPKQSYPQKKPLSSQNYQLLCIFPQSKKKQYFEKIKQRRSKQCDQAAKNHQKMGRMMQSTVLQRYSRKNNVETVELGTKMWVKNFKLYSKSLQDEIF